MALQLAALASVLATAGGRLTVPIGTLFNNKDKDLKQAISAMSFAMQEHELSNRSQEHVLKFYVDNIDTVDAYKLTKIICKQVRRNIPKGFIRRFLINLQWQNYQTWLDPSVRP